jgi:hypothetical protein
MKSNFRTFYITVACPGEITNREWKEWYKKQGRENEYEPPKPVYRDYALMKVLYFLKGPSWINRQVHAFKWEDPLKPLDFSGLKDSDEILIVGHGDHGWLYTMGPEGPEDEETGEKATWGRNTNRLVEILTKNGSLKEKRKDKDIKILLLSCRSGLGLHKVLARKLSKELGRDVMIGGAKGFTFGSLRTGANGKNEVLIKGLPWYMEFPRSISRKEAEKLTTEREGKEITFKDKRKVILAFQNESEELEKKMKDIIQKLKSTEVNKALDEIRENFEKDWLNCLWSQRMLYKEAREYTWKEKKLDFDMWYPDLNKAYVWTDGKEMTDQEVGSFLEGVKGPAGSELTSIR